MLSRSGGSALNILQLCCLLSTFLPSHLLLLLLPLVGPSVAFAFLSFLYISYSLTDHSSQASRVTYIPLLLYSSSSDCAATNFTLQWINDQTSSSADHFILAILVHLDGSSSSHIYSAILTLGSLSPDYTGNPSKIRSDGTTQLLHLPSLRHPNRFTASSRFTFHNL